MKGLFFIGLLVTNSSGYPLGGRASIQNDRAPKRKN